MVVQGLVCITGGNVMQLKRMKEDGACGEEDVYFYFG